MAFLKLNIPGLAAYFDNWATYLKTFWQPWSVLNKELESKVQEVGGHGAKEKK